MASSRGKILAAVIGVVVIVVGIVAVWLTVLAGHSGAEETWSERVEESDTSVMESEPEAMPVEPGNDTGASAEFDVLSIEAVAANNTPESCWAIIDGNVYDLTTWIDSHPGGSSRIIGLCGSDGTSQFQGQHGSSSSAQGTLESYLLGAIGDPVP